MQVHVERKIIFIVDPKGNTGKTVYLGWLGTQPGYQYFGIGKKDDVLYAANTLVNTYIMDIARSETKLLDYALLEKLKDGYWFTGKYDTKTCLAGNKNLVVTMNDYPDKHKLSKDRYDVYLIDNNFKLRSINYNSLP